MKRHFLKVAFVAMLALALLQACANVGNNGQQGAAVGGIIGAVVGQAIGHDTAGTLIGAAVGSMLGYIVGNEMDKADQMNTLQAINTMPSGQTSAWQNPNTGNAYEVTPQPAYDVATSQGTRKCRKATIRANIAGEGPQETVTTACFNEWSQQWEFQQ